MQKAVFVLFMSVTAAGSGCTTVVKRVFNEGKGASSDTDVVPGTGGASFAQFDSVEVAPPRSDLGDLVSSSFNTELVSALHKELVEDKNAPFKGGAATLSIAPQIQWYHKGGTIFPDKYAIVLFFLTSDGTDMGHVLITTKSEASRTGDKALAESTAEELRKHFEKHGKKRGSEDSGESSDS